MSFFHQPFTLHDYHVMVLHNITRLLYTFCVSGPASLHPLHAKVLHCTVACTHTDCCFWWLDRQWSKAALTCWLRVFGRALDLEHYLLPPLLPPQQRPPAPLQPAQPQPQQPPHLLQSRDNQSHPVGASVNVGNATAQDTAGASVSSTDAHLPHGELTRAGLASGAQHVASRTDVASSSSSKDLHGPLAEVQQRGANAAQQQNFRHQEAAAGSQHSSLFLPPLRDTLGWHAQPKHVNGDKANTAAANQSSASGQVMSMLEQSHPQALHHIGTEPQTVQLLANNADDRQGKESPAGLYQAAQDSIGSLQARAGSSQTGQDTSSSPHGSAGPSQTVQGSADGPQETAGPYDTGQLVPTSTSEEGAIAGGLAANTQVASSEELTGRLMILGLLLMCSLLLFVTGMLTIPCILGELQP